MASNDDFLASLKGISQNLSQMVSAFGAPGRFASSTKTSPLATLVTNLGSTSLTVVSFNINRRGISFHSCDATNNTTIFLTTLAVCTVGQAMPLLPGQSLFISADLASNAAWQAAAGTSTATNILMINEYV